MGRPSILIISLAVLTTDGLLNLAGSIRSSGIPCGNSSRGAFVSRPLVLLANYQVVVVVNDEGKPIGIKSVSDAAMINTAQRVDLLNDILP